MEQTQRFGPIELTTWNVREAQSLPAHARDAVSIHMPLWGTYRVSLAGEELQVDGLRPLVVSPGLPVTHHLTPSASQRIVRIDEGALNDSLARMLGRRPEDRILFTPSFDLTEPSAVRWTIAVQLLVAEAQTPHSLLGSPYGIPPVVDFLLSSLLLLVDSNYSPSLARFSVKGASLRHAMDYVEANLSGPLLLEDVADAAMVSPRTLQTLFTTRLGETFSEYVRGRRLERIRQDLQAGIPVAAAGARWGLSHGGRLAAWYRARFGETPAQTLR